MFCVRNFLIVVIVIGCLYRPQCGGCGSTGGCGGGRITPQQRILLDTDVDTDDIFALLYLLKLNTSDFHLQAITLNTNAWTDAAHGVNQIYDILYMMGRDDIEVGVGGEGGITEDGTIEDNVGGYLPLIEQKFGTVGYCRYRQAIPLGQGGILDIDTNFGVRRSFLPQGKRHYKPLLQPTVQQVMIDAISQGPITVFIIGSHTNFAIFLMKNPHLKKNIKHIYVMGGGVRSKNPSGCNVTSSHEAGQCGNHGNLFTDYTSNPYAEFNFFGDPFAAYQVIHSGIPLTLVPLDATNTIPITQDFFQEFEQNQRTYEAQYCFLSLQMAQSIFMWDSLAVGVATSIMLHNSTGKNEFAEMEYMNITVVTSNEPYGAFDDSNPFFDGRETPKFNLKKGGVHSGHVQTGLHDPFCIAKNGKGRCQDGYTKEVRGEESVRVLVSTKAKPNHEPKTPLNREFFRSFLDVLNSPRQTGRFNFTTQFPYYKQVVYKLDLQGKKLGKPVVYDMDMSAGDFLALFYLLKLPIEVVNLKAIIVSPTGWANAATIDLVYDVLHMMGRDDIPVGLGDVFAMNQTDSVFSGVGDCKYVKAIPHGSGGFLDSDSLFGFARDLPRSPRRYTAEISVKLGGPRDTYHSELRQLLAMEVWESITKTLSSGSKITVLTNGPLTNIAKIILSSEKFTSLIEEVLIVGGHVNYDNTVKGNVFTIRSNEYAEFNMFLDPLAAKKVFESGLNITLVPLSVQRKVNSYPKIIKRLTLTNETPEALFARRLLFRLHRLQKKHHRYRHMDTFLGETLGAVVLGGDSGDHAIIDSSFQVKPVKVVATGLESEDGRMVIDERRGKLIRILESVNPEAFYSIFADQLGEEQQSAVIASFEEQKRRWSVP